MRLLGEFKKYQRKVWLATGSVLFAYLFYLIFQFQTYGWWVVKWHTHLALPVFLFVAGAFVTRWLETLTGHSFARALKRWFYFCWILLSVELILMATGVGVMLGGAPWGRYVGTDYVPMKNRYERTWTPGIDVEIHKEEFSHIRKINSSGFADYEWNMAKPDTTYRVICLGDSFTEGDGADYSESYVAQLRKLWPKQGEKQVEIINAGICGSDPFDNFIHYKQIFHNYSPDLIIQTISSHDIMHDIFARGAERDVVPLKNGFFRSPFVFWQIFYTANYSI